MKLPNTIPNSSLQLTDIPSSDTEWNTISRFALTFNGYEEAGSFAAAGRIANEHRNDTLSNLRICLFFEQRRWHHFGRMPSGEALDYVRSLVEQIRQRVESGNLE